MYQTRCTGPMSFSLVCLVVSLSFTLPLSMPLSQAPSEDHQATVEASCLLALPSLLAWHLWSSLHQLVCSTLC